MSSALLQTAVACKKLGKLHVCFGVKYIAMKPKQEYTQKKNLHNLQTL